MNNKKSTNVVWQETKIKRQNREKMLKQKGAVLWFTGLSGSGKSTVASALEKKLYEMGYLTYLLDGDNLRYGLNSDLGFKSEDRTENIRRVSEVAKLFADAGIITITTFISPFIEDRNNARKLLGKDFVEVYIDCPIEVCEKRDPKGIYKKARNGEIKNFTGIDSPYEKPEKPEITVETYKDTEEKCVDNIIEYLKQHKIL
ncbi:adenylylsulfate kinase [Clostridium acetobutylicum]|uniref:Adenylyl-sulfate kinase n=1 Tax=Clostridium acetobutylicum (strain ATCC 824 / DSM 792 / JCM 1419 / IAM 19013 / LMG 5710 / NBRC 13948 / NRRL B-527 / VKM B-1787 / 2291 / W) TaxID=272562 RepID=CYSC_CLOAB|nr:MULTISPECIES: adenylyl-sulfate kinase [Clostridium]Q97MT8.1 RecName: Full=Adenylyl-sulfate kinase; AltName: Full=APS kinase; AltName: Full=ATP adenosine-5'-phosphosulfate 3'-phosphotransferase; AltName: Full=Adenosine-5'-phosphosulfate kinase [Clostridium acetobutylicum ATCC 824]AAK78088.1 Adenylylsulfate kinase [Clostridium acetobutylicum ATCC 824]ADZ19147.1 Adenylylsulfate kinase [Clostridium acetobutylicum EA 2018]AEI34081.1 adenylylsulfate kinase [Clostridium acetobutylicum DSM 1731]AWV